MGVSSISHETVPTYDITQMICAAVLDMLIQGRLELGSRLPEVELCKRLGVSRPSLRGAFRVLEQQGLISIEPRKGATVMLATADDLRDLCEYRATLEDMAVRLAVPRMDADVFSVLDDCVAQMRIAAQMGSVTGMLDSDMAFHRVIYDLSGNPYLLAALKNLAIKVRVYSFIRKKQQSSFDVTFRYHVTLLNAYKTGDVALAAAANRRHVMVDSLGGGIDFLRGVQGQGKDALGTAVDGTA